MLGFFKIEFNFTYIFEIPDLTKSKMVNLEMNYFHIIKMFFFPTAEHTSDKCLKSRH